MTCHRSLYCPIVYILLLILHLRIDCFPHRHPPDRSVHRAHQLARFLLVLVLVLIICRQCQGSQGTGQKQPPRVAFAAAAIIVIAIAATAPCGAADRARRGRAVPVRRQHR